MSRKLINPRRIVAMAVLLVIILSIFMVRLYNLQIIEGEKYYNQASAISETQRTVTAARGNILDRYGRLLVSNKECYNLKIDVTKLFANPDPNATILQLVKMVQSFGDSYTDDLPVSMEPPFTYNENMTEIQRTMLSAYFKDKGKALPEDPTAVELLSYMRTRYNIDNSYSSEEMRLIAGVRYSINVRYAVNTAEYMFVEDASMELISSIMENKLNGIEVERAFMRDYGTPYAAHLLGYVGLMTQEEFERYSLLDYANDAVVGKDGIEYAFETDLHGKDGEVIEYRNAAGTILSTVYLENPEPGHHVYLTIDIALQEQVEKILAHGIDIMRADRSQLRAERTAAGEYDPETKDEITGAAIVVVDTRTGEPLAIASWPTFDVSTIIEKYAELLETPNAPLFNRALMGAYAPGSTFKPCVAMACLTEGIINTEFKVKCEGVFTRYAAEGYAPECWIWRASSNPNEHWTHGEDNVTAALRDSCNYFFYTISHELGIDDMGTYAHAFGLGVPTGIELVETVGNMSNAANHADYTGTTWRIGDTLQAGIGQSDSIFSPLQIAEYCATVANSGYRHSASILKAIRSYDYSQVLYERETEVLSIVQSDEWNWDAVHEGMHQVLHDWSVNAANAEWWVDCAWDVAGKTGTAQKGEKITNDGIFMCYAPFDDPEVAIAVVVERGGSGASTQFMARQVMDAYINIKSYRDTSESEMALLK